MHKILLIKLTENNLIQFLYNFLKLFHACIQQLHTQTNIPDYTSRKHGKICWAKLSWFSRVPP